MLRLDFFVFQGTLLHGIHPPSHLWVLLPWEHLFFVPGHLCLPHLLIPLKLLSSVLSLIFILGQSSHLTASILFLTISNLFNRPEFTEFGFSICLSNPGSLFSS